MKRVLAFIVLYAALLTACSMPADPKTVFILPASAASDEWQPTWIEIDEVPYQYGNALNSGMVWDTTDAVIMGLYNNDRYYFGRYIKSIGRFEPYCDLIACDHYNNECPVGNSINRVDAHNGTITINRILRGEPDLFTKLRTPDMSWICELRGNHAVPVAGPFNIAEGLPASTLCGNSGYYVISDGSLLYLPYDSKKPQALLDEFSLSRSVVVGETLYATDFKTVYRIDLSGTDGYMPQPVIIDAMGYGTEGSYLYYSAKTDGRSAIFRCNMDGSNVRILARQDFSYLWTFTFDKNYMYYVLCRQPEYPDQNAVYRLPLEGGEPEAICVTYADIEDVYALPTSPDALLVCGSFQSGYYFLPKTGGELLPIEHP